MALVRPFQGLRPPANLVLKVACPPYDVVSTEEAREYARGNPVSFFHVSRPEIGLPPDADPYSRQVYDLGRKNLERFEREGVLRRDPAACFYLYSQTMGAHRQTGLVAVASAEEYARGAIRKHELTRKDKEDDRTRHIEALSAHDEPVFLIYRARASLEARLAGLERTIPSEYDFQAEDGIRHEFRVLREPAVIAAIQAEFAQLSTLYIADGHHRSAAAARVWSARTRAGQGAGECAHFLAVIFPHDRLQVLDYNRVVKDLNGLSPKDFLAAISSKFEVLEARGPRPSGPRRFGLFFEGRWRELRARDGSFDATDPVRSLDVSILQENLLAPVLGIADPRADKRIDFVGGIRGTAELEKLVASGRFRAAFSMFPTTTTELIAIADADQIMPPKSTWFEPKLRSGVVVHTF